jgi:hypothetical protein
MITSITVAASFRRGRIGEFQLTPIVSPADERIGGWRDGRATGMFLV